MSVVTGCIRTAGLFKDSGAEFDGTKIPGLVSTLAQSVLALWRDSIVVNSTVEPTQKIRTASNGLRIEVPLLQFAQSRLGVKSIDSGRDVRVLQVNRFNPKDKFMSTIIKHKGGHGYRLLVKGASDIILAMCSSTVNPTVGINPIDLTADDRKSLQDRIAGYGDSTLKTISFAFRDFETWPGEEIVTGGLTFLAVMGILNPVRGGSVTGVKDCKKLDLSVRMVTGDNIHTAKAVAKECGIYTDGKAMKGSDFYQLSRPDQLTVLPTLQVLAECRPKDKHVIVERLKELGETVAITGSDADDAIAVKSADVGYAPIWASEIVKEAADFEMRLDSFSYISRTFTSYRSLREAAPKILQFQIPNTIITATVIFVTSVANGNNSCLLTIFHVYWLTLGVGAIVAQALGKEPPLSPINFTLNKIAMWKMIIGQTIYQLTAILVLY
ncbi:HAD-like protein, partial [Piedraia hortae CBS 480.64]